MAASNVLPLWDYPYLQWVWPVLESREGDCADLGLSTNGKGYRPILRVNWDVKSR
jgi:hypothetical protein